MDIFGKVIAKPNAEYFVTSRNIFIRVCHSVDRGRVVSIS